MPVSKDISTPQTPSAVIFGCAGTVLSEEEKALFQKVNPLGLILFSRNIQDEAQVRALVESFKAQVSHVTPLILVDQEGGRVDRLRQLGWRKNPAMDCFAELAELDEAAARRAVYLDYRLIAGELTRLGINVDCAPVLDLKMEHAHEIIGDRAFGETPEQVVMLAREACRGLLDGGILPVIKHIPGHGRALVDSHAALPEVPTALDVLEQTDFIPFQEMSGMPLAMTAHITYTALDEQHCATLSPEVVGYIRNRLGYDGLLMTDDLSMHALSGAMEDRVRLALAAGCDVILHCNGELEEMQAIAGAVPLLNPHSKARLTHAWQFFKAPEVMDAEQSEAELAELLGQLAQRKTA